MQLHLQFLHENLLIISFHQENPQANPSYAPKLTAKLLHTWSVSAVLLACIELVLRRLHWHLVWLALVAHLRTERLLSRWSHRRLSSFSWIDRDCW